jgi:hypothetical protein
MIHIQVHKSTERRRGFGIGKGIKDVLEERRWEEGRGREEK